MPFIPWSNSSLRRACLLHTISHPSPRIYPLRPWLLLHATDMARLRPLPLPIHCGPISKKWSGAPSFPKLRIWRRERRRSGCHGHCRRSTRLRRSSEKSHSRLLNRYLSKSRSSLFQPPSRNVSQYIIIYANVVNCTTSATSAHPQTPSPPNQSPYSPGTTHRANKRKQQHSPQHNHPRCHISCEPRRGLVSGRAGVKKKFALKYPPQKLT